MRNGHENDDVRGLLPTERNNAKKGPGRYFINTSMKHGTYTFGIILINF